MRRSFLLTIALSMMVILAACSAYGGSATQPTTAATQAGSSGGLDVITVNVVDNATYGKILVNSQGMTLYLYTKDTPNTSNCYDQCATNWPPLIVSGTPTGGADIDSAKLGTTKRTDGSMQVTYNGWPLYTYISDKAAGDTTGQNVGSVWFVVSPAGDKITAEVNSTSSSGNEYGSAGDTTSGSVAAAAQSGDVAVAISNFAFSPSNLIVKVGSTVTWTNDDSAAHTVVADDGSFSSGNLDKGATYSYTFSKEGTFAYHCGKHASMLATVMVVP